MFAFKNLNVCFLNSKRQKFLYILKNLMGFTFFYLTNRQLCGPKIGKSSQGKEAGGACAHTVHGMQWMSTAAWPLCSLSTREVKKEESSNTKASGSLAEEAQSNSTHVRVWETSQRRALKIVLEKTQKFGQKISRKAIPEYFPAKA